MVFEGRMVDSSDQIHHALRFLCFAVSHRWQAAAQAVFERHLQPS
jgi:hypothetical protein